MQVRISTLKEGDNFETCLTGLLGFVSHKHKHGVAVVFADAEKVLHPNVIVRYLAEDKAVA